jgi:DNA-binding XRE family transcriptional regulator
MGNITDIQIDKTELRIAREECGLSQAEAARQLGISRQTLWSYESGEGLPSANILARMCVLYKREIGTLTAAA